jgi:hypothetical protein
MRKYIGLIIRHHLWIPALGSIIAVILLGVYLSLVSLPQALTVNGLYVREDNRVFHRFINDIKKQNGVLIIGTSETVNGLEGANYWGILNNDKTGTLKYSLMAGAGRDYSILLPLVLNNPRLYKDLKILVYINPTYWRVGLNNFNNEYFERYIGPNVAIGIKEKAKAIGLYEDFIKPAQYNAVGVDTLEDSFAEKMRREINGLRSLFYYDFNRLIHDKEKIVRYNLDFDLTEEKITELKNGLNLEYNVLQTYLDTNPTFPAIDLKSSYRYTALYEFIALCKENNIQATFYLGPYNGIFCNKKSPELIPVYEELIQNIKMIISSAHMPLIDGTAQSQIPGTFMDVQHISKYGAFLTAKQIQSYYETSD